VSKRFRWSTKLRKRYWGAGRLGEVGECKRGSREEKGERARGGVGVEGEENQKTNFSASKQGDGKKRQACHMRGTWENWERP